MQNSNPAVVLGGGITGLGVIRNLGRNGIQVSCIIDRKDEAMFSRYCKDYFIVPKGDVTSDTLVRFLSTIEKRFGEPPVVFPTTDIYLLTLCKSRNQMGFCRLPLPRPDVVEKLVVKKKFYQSLISKKVPHPKTIISPKIDEVNPDLMYPVFVKPSISQIFLRAFGKKGFSAGSENELRTYLEVAEKHNVDVMVQEIIPGPPTNHIFIDGYFNENSRPLALFARQRIRMWPLSFGNSTVCESIPISEVKRLKETIVRYLREIRFSGIFSAEFKQDPRDGVGKLIEINARSWWYNSYPSRCGVNIILIAYLDAIGKEVQYTENYEEGVRLIYLTEDLRASFRMFMSKELTLRDWASQLSSKKDWLFFAKDDISPSIMNIAYTISRAARKFF